MLNYSVLLPPHPVGYLVLLVDMVAAPHSSSTIPPHSRDPPALQGNHVPPVCLLTVCLFDHLFPHPPLHHLTQSPLPPNLGHHPCRCQPPPQPPYSSQLPCIPPFQLQPLTQPPLYAAVFIVEQGCTRAGCRADPSMFRGPEPPKLTLDFATKLRG